MKRTTRILYAFLLVSALSPLVPRREVWSAGSEEQAGSDRGIPERIVTYLVVRQGEPVNEQYMKQFHGTASVAAFFWSTFTREKEVISLTSDGKVPAATFTAGTRERSQDYEIRSYLVKPIGPPSTHISPRRPATKTLTISFRLTELLAGRGDVRMQPYRYALVKGATESGYASGSIRLLFLSWNDAGRFDARVEISRS